MKWREPWAVSLEQQPRFNLLGRGVLKSALTWSAVLAVLIIVRSLGEDLPVQLERLSRLWVAPAVGVPLAALLYVVEWLSPRKVDSGPKGIVVSKGERMSLIPWEVIAKYAFVESGGLRGLRLTDKDGGSLTLFLPDKVRLDEVERELVERTGKGSVPAPLHSL
jgi:hypothetical protein